MNSEARWTPQRPFQALALTGGGYRGLFTARVLQTIEDHIQAPIASRFDLITGTSIGGIIAIAAALEVPMSRVVNMFEKHGERIFNGSHPRSTWAKRWDLMKHWWRVRYSADTMRDAICEIIPPETTLACARHAIAIPAVNVTQGRPQIFKTRHRPEWTRDAAYLAVDVALATSAAPTYFELAQLDGNLYADGGLFANAPDLIALHEAETFFSVGIECIRLLSVGTTTRSYSVSFAAGRKYAISDWMENGRLFDVTISAQQQFVDQVVKHRLKDRYVRIDHEPSAEQTLDLGLDRATPSARHILMALGRKAASDVLSTTLAPMLAHEPQLSVLNAL